MASVLELVNGREKFPLPEGEFLIGSDPACPVHLTAPGVLPVHAHAVMERDGILRLRPLGGELTGEELAKSSLAVNGELATGPSDAVCGDTVCFGAAVYRLQPPGSGIAGLARRMWAYKNVRVFLYTLVSVLTLVLCIGLYLQELVFSERALKYRASIVFAELTDRSSQNILTKKAELNWSEGTLALTGVKLEAGKNSAVDGEIEKIEVRFEPWKIWGALNGNLNGLKVRFSGVKLNIVRGKGARVNVAGLWEGISRKLNGALAGTQNPTFELNIDDSELNYDDTWGGTGKSALTDLKLSIIKNGDERPAKVEFSAHASGGTTGGSGTQVGSISAEGLADWIGSGKGPVTDALTVPELRVRFRDFDLARVFEHAGFAWEPYGADFKVVPGKPVSGEALIHAESLKDIVISGSMFSSSLVSVRENEHAPLGNLPMQLECDKLRLTLGPNGFVPGEVSIRLRAGGDERGVTPCLIASALGRDNLSGESNYTFFLECRPGELLDTDVGRRLGLDGRIGGQLNGNATVRLEPTGAMRLDLKLNGQQTYLRQPPTAGQSGATTRPFPLEIDLQADAQPPGAGERSYLEIGALTVATPSFKVTTAKQGGIRGMESKQGKGAHAQAQLKIELDGRGFWNDFGPVLSLFGLDWPIEEKLTLEASAAGQGGRLELIAKGTAERQWDADPAPLQVKFSLDYDRTAGLIQPARPWLTLSADVIEDGAEPIDLHADVRLRNDAGWSYSEFGMLKSDTPGNNRRGIRINAGATRLKSRFDPYLAHMSSRFHNGEALYKDTQVNGQIRLDGNCLIAREDRPDGTEIRVFDTQTQFKGTIDAPGKLAEKARNFLLGAQKSKGEAPPNRFVWTEKTLDCAVKGAWKYLPGATPAQSGKTTLDLGAVKFSGSAGTLDLTAAGIDCNQLPMWLADNAPVAASTQKPAFPLNSVSFDAKLEPPAFTLLRQLRILKSTDLINGTIALKSGWDRTSGTLDVSRCDLKFSAGSSLSRLDTVFKVLRAEELYAALPPLGAGGGQMNRSLIARLVSLTDAKGLNGMLSHLGPPLEVRSLMFDAGAYFKQYRPGKDEIVFSDETIPPGLLPLWRPRGKVELSNLKLARTGIAGGRVWSLTADRARGAADAVWALNDNANKYENAPRLSLSGDWQFQIRFDAAVDHLAADGAFVLDQAAVLASWESAGLSFEKPQGAPARIELQDWIYSSKPYPLARAALLKLSGESAGAEMRNLALEFPEIGTGSGKSGGGKIKLGSISMTGTAFPFQASVGFCDFESGRIETTVAMDDIPLERLNKLLAGSGRTYSGSIGGFQADYAGRIEPLRKLIQSQPMSEGLTFPPPPPPAPGSEAAVNESANDGFWGALDPEKDLLNIRAELKDTLIADESANNRHELALNGQIRLSPRDVQWENARLTTSIENAGAKRTFGATSPLLKISALEPVKTVYQALRRNDLPLALRGAITLSQPTGRKEISDALECLSLITAANVNKPGVNPPAGLVFEGVVDLPGIDGAPLPLEKVKLENVVMRGGVLTFSPGSAVVVGAALAVTDARFNLMPGDGSFALNFKLAGFDLLNLAGIGEWDTAGICASGQVAASGMASGLNPAEMMTWKCSAAMNITNPSLAVASLPAPLPDAPMERAPWANLFSGLSPQRYKLLTEAAVKTRVQLMTLAPAEVPVPQADIQAAGSTKERQQSLRLASAVVLAWQLYGWRTLGLEPGRFDFESVKCNVLLESGVFTSDGLMMVGNGASAGLTLDVRGGRLNFKNRVIEKPLEVLTVSVPKAAEAHYAQHYWPGNMLASYRDALKSGSLAFRISGGFDSLEAQFPWQELKIHSRRALLGTETVSNPEELTKAREHLARFWAVDGNSLAAAADLADLAWAGLPGTISSRQQGETLLDRMSAPPSYMLPYISKLGPVLPPRLALNKLLYPEVPPPVAPPPPLRTK